MDEQLPEAVAPCRVRVLDARRVQGQESEPVLPTKVDFPTADFWYLRNGKVEVFDCHIAFTTLFAQLGILPDYASAVAASAPKR